MEKCFYTKSDLVHCLDIVGCPCHSIMPNPIQKIIQEAKDRGYVPKKKDVSLSTFNEDFNQAIDSYNLPKIIELAYEEGKKGDTLQDLENLRKELFEMMDENTNYNGKITSSHFKKELNITLFCQLPTNLSNNKEE